MCRVVACSNVWRNYMNNKIEKGCLAIVVNSYCPENLGKVVTVGNYIGTEIGFLMKDLWEVDKPMLASDGKYYFLQRENSLMRIDNYDEDMYTLEQIEQLEKEKME
jgi:hypothetical protein